MAESVIAIFDIGKTNKKVFLFDKGYNVVFERSTHLTETTDEDGEPCEDLAALIDWFNNSITGIFSLKEFDCRAVNFATYGASFVLVDSDGNAIPPLYNYLKTFPASLSSAFYEKYDDGNSFSLITASPALGSLNSGLQLFRLKKLQPQKFSRVQWALHLPQFVSYLLTKKAFADMTSIGCHTALWHFRNHTYHPWVDNEGVAQKLPPIVSSDYVVDAVVEEKMVKVGVGLHDSSAALIPYLMTFKQPFTLISTGTWSISLNPFNQTSLTTEELSNDCLCYLQFNGKQVKASRLFAGHFHDEEVKRIAGHFRVGTEFYKTIRFTNDKGDFFKAGKPERKTPTSQCVFAEKKLELFQTAEEAYLQLMTDLVWQQASSTELVLQGSNANDLYVDGGFCSNDLYMHFLALAFPEKRVFAASLAQATALGAALAIHPSWNENELPDNLIKLKSYNFTHGVIL